MKTTGEFTTHRYDIKFEKYNEPIYLIPFGDVHRSSPLCHVDKWKEFCDWARKKKNAYFIGMGDYDDLLSTSERPILGSHLLHESTTSTLEDTYRFHTDKLAKEISFMRGRIVGLLEGNHYAKFQNGTTTTQRLCEALDCRYLGVSSFIALSLKYDQHHTHRIIIWAHHGLSGGRTLGASINKIEHMLKVAQADIYLMGHDHKKHIAMENILTLPINTNNGELTLSAKKILMARTGSFLKGYVPNQRSYVVDSALSPTDIGVIKIEMTPKRFKKEKVEERFVDLHASL